MVEYDRVIEVEPPPEGVQGFRKVRWTNGEESTAGLIFTTQDLKSMSLPDLSRYWPPYEALKMKKVEASQVYPTFDEAFNSRDFDPVADGH